jgi:hypothetical protein
MAKSAKRSATIARSTVVSPRDLSTEAVDVPQVNRPTIRIMIAGAKREVQMKSERIRTAARGGEANGGPTWYPLVRADLRPTIPAKSGGPGPYVSRAGSRCLILARWRADKIVGGCVVQTAVGFSQRRARAPGRILGTSGRLTCWHSELA